MDFFGVWILAILLVRVSFVNGYKEDFTTDGKLGHVVRSRNISKYLLLFIYNAS